MAAVNHVIIPVEGILARCKEQHMPLLLERFGSPKYFNAESGDGYVESKRLYVMLRSSRAAGKKVTLIGSSWGGNVATLAVAKLVREDGVHDLNDWLRLILVDSPFGRATMPVIPGFVSEDLLLSPAGRMILNAFGPIMMTLNSKTSMGLPKDEFITVPPPRIMKAMTSRDDMSEKEWKDWVKQTAQKFLTGHSKDKWRDQIIWMASVVKDGELQNQLPYLRDVMFYFVQCTVGNDVVSEPDSLNAHLSIAGYTNPDGSDRDRVMLGAHCGYLQNQPQAEEALAPLLVW